MGVVYLGCEHGHFLSAMGTDVTIIGRGHSVLDNEDPEICGILKAALSGYLKLITSNKAVSLEQKGEIGLFLPRRLKDRRFQAVPHAVSTNHHVQPRD